MNVSVNLDKLLKASEIINDLVSPDDPAFSPWVFEQLQKVNDLLGSLKVDGVILPDPVVEDKESV